MSRVKAFVFDAYGTLFDVYSVTAMCEECFPGNGQKLAALWRAKQLQYSLLRSIMERYKDFWEVTRDALVFSINQLELEPSPAPLERLMDAYLRLSAFSDVRPGLQALKERGVRLAILSNGSAHMLSQAVEHAGIAQFLDDLISVDDVRIFKPSPRVYRLLDSRFPCAAAEIGFVSANNWDIHGAGATGLTTFWMQRSAGERPDELGFPATHTVRTMGELPSFIP